MASHIANSSQGAALVAAILSGDAALLGAALGELHDGSMRLECHYWERHWVRSVAVVRRSTDERNLEINGLWIF